MSRGFRKSVGGGPAGQFFCLLGAIAGAVAAGWVEMHNAEVQPPLLVVLVCSFILGMIGPTGPWRWAVIVGLGVPLANIVGPSIGMHPVDAKPIGWLGLATMGVIAIIPGLIGAYFGAMLRRLAQSSAR